ncbi:MAG: NAD(P)-dependent oxidoreductase [Gammaproteobacteria bacterium]|nr:NAD(P)-dependent oxidoreductase [Gammaproteobacteria bacterium]
MNAVQDFDSQPPVVVAGCGDMGLPMAKQLLTRGFEVHGFDVRPAEQFGDFAPRMLSNLDKVTANTVLIVVVRDAQQIRQLCFDEQAIYTRKTYPLTLVISSTVSPRLIEELRDRLPGDVVLIDAPMSGATYSAEAGTLTFMLGGARSEIDRLQSLFAAMGDTIHYMGESGQGMLTKVLNNYVAASSVVAVRRSLARASVEGLDASTLLKVMSASSGSTWFGDNLEKIYWSREGYTPDNTIGIVEKDVRSSLDIASVSTDGFDEALLQALRDLETVK